MLQNLHIIKKHGFKMWPNCNKKQPHWKGFGVGQTVFSRRDSHAMEHNCRIRVERKHFHILNVARGLRFQANLPIEFWGECVLAAGYLISRNPFLILQGKTPYEILFQSPPSYNHLKIFGCLCYDYHHQRPMDNFESRSRRCVFVGYPHAKKWWKVYDLETGDIFVSRDVIFDEHQFPFAKNKEEDPSSHTLHTYSQCFWQSNGMLDDDCSRENISRQPTNSPATVGPGESGPNPGPVWQMGEKPAQSSRDRLPRCSAQSSNRSPALAAHNSIQQQVLPLPAPSVLGQPDVGTSPLAATGPGKSEFGRH